MVVVGSSGWGWATGDDGASAVVVTVSVCGSAGSVTGGGCGCDVWLTKPALRCALRALNISARRSLREDIDRGAPEEKLAGGLAGLFGVLRWNGRKGCKMLKTREKKVGRFLGRFVTEKMPGDFGIGALPVCSESLAIRFIEWVTATVRAFRLDSGLARYFRYESASTPKIGAIATDSALCVKVEARDSQSHPSPAKDTVAPPYASYAPAIVAAPQRTRNAGSGVELARATCRIRVVPRRHPKDQTLPRPGKQHPIRVSQKSPGVPVLNSLPRCAQEP